MVRDLRQLEGTLITDIYAALLGHGNWQTFVDRVTEILPEGKATMFYHDYTAGSGALSINSGFGAEIISAYSQYYAAKNPWMPKAFTRPLGHGVRSEQMMPREDLLRTEFYADYLRPQGLCSGVGVTIFRDKGCNFMLSVLSGPAEDDEASAAADLLTRLAPHLRQAFTYYRNGIAGVSRTRQRRTPRRKLWGSPSSPSDSAGRSCRPMPWLSSCFRPASFCARIVKGD
mgnify:FL=1